MTDLARVKRNVAKMASMGAPVEDIDGYIESEGTTVDAVKAYKAASPQAADLTQEEKLARDYGPHMKEYKSKLQELPQNVDSVARKVASGLTFGLADEFAAGMRSLTEDGSYSDKLTEERARDKAISEEHPVISTVAEGVGSALPILATGGALAPAAGANALTRLGVYGATGALTGGASGFGNAEGGLENRLEGAGKGAAIGGALGAAIPAVGMLARKGAELALSPFRGMSNAEPVAVGKIVEALRRDGLTPEQIAQRLKELGPDATLLDAGGRNVLGLGRAVSQAPGATKDAAEKVLGGRQADMAKRVVDALDDAVPGVGQFEFRMSGIMDRRAQAAKPLYEEAFKLPLQATDEMAHMLSRPAGKDALRKAVNIAANEGDDAAANMLRRLAKDGGVRPGSMYNSKIMDYVARGLDDVLDAYRDGTTGRLNLDTNGRAIAGLRDAYTRALREANPVLAQARAAWSGPTQVMDAMRKGAEAPLIDPRKFRSVMASVSEMDRPSFLEGVAEQIRAAVLRPNSGINVAKQIFDSPARREVLQEAFGPEKFAAFEKAMRGEMQKFTTQAAIRGGSPTAPRLEEGVDMAQGVDAGRALVRGDFGGAAMNALRALSGRLKGPEAVRDAIGKSLLAQGNDAQAAVKALEKAVAAGTIDPMDAAMVQAMIGATGSQSVAGLTRR